MDSVALAKSAHPQASDEEPCPKYTGPSPFETDDRAAAEAILAAQSSRSARLAIANDVIVNDGPLDALDGIVARLHACYQRLAAKPLG